MVSAYNTLTKRVEPIKPTQDNTIRMFVCGPTVYDFIHAGNARTFVIFDMIAKYLRYRGQDVYYIQNITDIDNRIIHRAHEDDISTESVAREYEEAFLSVVHSLGITSVNRYARASEHIQEIIFQIQALIKKGYAYAVPAVAVHDPDGVAPGKNHDVYFSVAAYEEHFPNSYGKLSGQIGGQLEEGTRVALEENKKDARDFVLWKAQNYTYEPTWESPWGLGRPGWHIEDTAISEKYLGQQYDLHGGGQDLIFPHHEAEIAQQQAASGKVPFVVHWMHSGFLVTKDEKMSKSLGNFRTAKDLLETYSPEALRFFFLSAHYRAPLDFTDQGLTQAAMAIERIQEFLRRLQLYEENTPFAHAADTEMVSRIQTFSQDALAAMDDDFNTPRAIAILFDLIRFANQMLDENKIDMHIAGRILELLDFYRSVLGVIPASSSRIPEEITRMAAERQRAKTDRDFKRADELRNQIEQAGYAIDDTPHGPMIKKKER